MSNYFISYPRSGRVWQEIRMLNLLEIRNIPPNVSLTNRMYWYLKRVINTHFGFAPEGGVLDAEPFFSFQKGDNAFVLLRNAKAAVSSYFYYIYGNLNQRIPGFVNTRDIEKNIDAFVRGGFGVSRLCDYMNKVDEKIKSTDVNVKWLYYENSFNITFLKALSEVLGIEPITEEEAKTVFEATLFSKMRENPYYFVSSSERVGKINSYKESISKESQEYIDDYLREYCILNEYRSEYL